MSIDWFQPFDSTTHSTGAIQIAILNLPRHLRYLKENIIIYSVIPGPKEPAQLDSILNGLVDQLLDLYRNGVTVKVDGKEETIRCLLLGLHCDLPASRKASGHAGHNAIQGCARCKQSFPYINKKQIIICRESHEVEEKRIMKEGKVVSDWWRVPASGLIEPLLLTDVEHRRHMNHYNGLTSKKERAAYQRKTGATYTVFARLPYFDTVRMVTVDPLHCLYLGVAKRFWKSVIQDKLVTAQHLKRMQLFVDSCTLPKSIARLPRKIHIASTRSGDPKGLSKLTGAEWKTWTLVLSSAAMSFAGVPSTIRTIWESFVDACTLLQKPKVDEINLYDARGAFGKFHFAFQQMTIEPEDTDNKEEKKKYHNDNDYEEKNDDEPEGSDDDNGEGKIDMFGAKLKARESDGEGDGDAEGDDEEHAVHIFPCMTQISLCASAHDHESIGSLKLI